MSTPRRALAPLTFQDDKGQRWVITAERTESGGPVYRKRRPRRDKLEAHWVMLSEDHVKAAVALGNGDFSSGVRRALGFLT